MIQEIQDFDDFCLWTYVVVDDIWREIGKVMRRPGPEPRCSDSELMTMTLVGECRGWAMETELLSSWREPFVRGTPTVLPPPAAVWINPPQGVGQPTLGAASDVSWYTAPARTEDKAPLESDLSAVRAAA